jgi:hypothetical protein
MSAGPVKPKVATSNAQRPTSNVQWEEVTVSALLREIRGRLAAIEDNLIWVIKPEQRFRIGHRVEFSRRAVERGIAKRKRSSKGYVKSIVGFSVVVQFDGQKQRHTYHHAFFNPVTGPKLF